MSRRSKGRGISTVLGAAIFVAIVFTIIFPLMLYMHVLQDLYMREASDRLRYEIERFNEKLEIHVSTGKPDALGRATIYAYLYNPSHLEVNVVAFYVESKLRGLIPIELSTPIVLAPGAQMVYHIPVTIDPDDEVTVRAATARGRSYSAPEVGLSVRKPPYIIFVSLTNTSSRSWYRVIIQANGVVGCVSPGVSINTICQEEANYTIPPPAIFRLFDKDDAKPAPTSYAFFHAMPGSYTVHLTEVFIDDNGNVVENMIASTMVNVTGRDVHLVFELEPKEPLMSMSVLLPSNNTVTLIPDGNPPQGAVWIPFTISLGNMSEPIEDVRVRLSRCTGHNITVVPRISTVDVSYMLPSESYTGSFEVFVQDDSQNSSKGGWIEFEVTVSAKGSFTGSTYGDLATVNGMVYVCVPRRIGGEPVLACNFQP